MPTHTTLLIVDDSTENLKLLGNSLKNVGFRILAALNGKQALALAEGKQPDLIILDVMMPEMNGFEVCEALKANELTRRIPVIFLTASIEIESIKNGFDAGGVDYISKPFNPDELILRVKNHLKQKNEKENLERELRFKSYILKNIRQGITIPLSDFLRTFNLEFQGYLPETSQKRIEQIHSTLNAIMKFAWNLTDLAHAEDPNITKENSEIFKLQDALKTLENNPNLLYEKDILELTIETHSVGDFYTGNKNKLLQALSILVGDVLKRSNHGCISITANLVERQEMHDTILIEVSSIQKTGEQLISNYTASSPHEISLLTAKELLLFVNGTIITTPFQSLTPHFSIEISLAHSLSINSLEEKKESSSFKEKKILVVEDNELNQRLIESVLLSYGAQIAIAHNGEEALQKIHAATFDLILMDINVPLRSGIEVAKVIRAKGIQTPIIAISGFTDKASIQRCIDSGINSFLSKPFQINELHKLVLKELEKNSSSVNPVKEFHKDAIYLHVQEADNYSLERLNELANGDKELIRNWIDHFKNLVVKGIAETTRVLEAKKYTSENRIFHDLNNYTSYFGVELLREYLKDLPKIHTSASVEELMNHIRLISDELKSIDRHFKQEEEKKKKALNL